METIVLGATQLKAIAICAADQDVRYYLNGVLIEATRTSTRLVATDGHRLAALCMDESNQLDGDVREFILPRSVIEKIKPSKKKLENYLCIEIKDGTYTLKTATGLSIGFVPVDGKFPDYRRVLPKETTGEAAQFNLAYLVDFQKIAGMLSGARLSYPKVEHNGPGCARVTCTTAGFIGAVMPLNDKKIMGDYPTTVWPELPVPQKVRKAA